NTPYRESGGSISISSRRAGLGSSSTTSATFLISRRNRLGIRAMASVTRRSKAARVMARSRASRRPCGFHGPLGCGAQTAIVIALVDHQALVAERLRSADAAAVKDLHV